MQVVAGLVNILLQLSWARDCAEWAAICLFADWSAIFGLRGNEEASLAPDANVIYIQVPAIVGGLKACNCLRFVSINTGYYLLGTRQPLVSAMVYDLRFWDSSEQLMLSSALMLLACNSSCTSGQAFHFCHILFGVLSNIYNIYWIRAMGQLTGVGCIWFYWLQKLPLPYVYALACVYVIAVCNVM